jgi:hypothetical protein
MEHKKFTLVDFEVFSLQIIGLLDSIEAMKKSGENRLAFPDHDLSQMKNS